jgi:PKD repeat protein
VTTAQTDETAATADPYNQYGDYIGMSAHAGALIPSWTDRRNNAKEEIWTAQIQDAPPPPVPPTALFSFTCSALSCSFDGSGSTDDRGIVSYAWTFGDSLSGSGATASHSYAATGNYSVTLTVTDTNGLTSSVSRKVSVNSDALPAAESFFTVPRCRVLDTRSGAPLSSGIPRVVSIAGNCNIPSSAKAVSLVVTAIQPTDSGFLGLYPGNLSSTAPNKGSLNFLPATSPRSNNAVVRLATDGSGTLGLKPTVNGSPGQVHLALDVDGYFSEDTVAAAGAQGPFGFQAIDPCRAVDTRLSSPLVSGVPRTFPIQGVCGVPASGVGAVSSNLKVVPTPAYGGSIVLYAAGASVPTAANLSFNANINWLSEGARAGLSNSTPDLGIQLDSSTGSGSVHAVFDVNGYFASGGLLRYHPLAGCREVDTRSLDTGGPSITGGSTRTFQIQGNCNVPVGAKAVFLNAVALGATGTFDVRLYPSSGAAPAVGTLSFDNGESAVGNGTIVPLATSIPDLKLTASPSTGTVDVIVDVFGYFQ